MSFEPYRQQAVAYCASRLVPHNGTLAGLARALMAAMGMPTPAGALTDAHAKRIILRGMIVQQKRVDFAKRQQAKRERKATKRFTKKTRRTLHPFYISPEWKRLRYDAIKASDGRCKCCGRSPADGIVLNVDHVKPIKTHPHLRLEPTNLQVLCNLCNEGKGNRDATDWRR